MARLNEKDARELERLQKLKEAPDPEPIGRTVHAHVDFGKKDQVEMARRYGFLREEGADGGGSEEEEGDDGGGDDGGGNEGGGTGGRRERRRDGVPKRSGYFDKK